MEWTAIGRPGYLGAQRDDRYAEWNRRYGAGNWRLVWLVEGAHKPFPEAVALYEEAYLRFLIGRPEILNELLREACDVYDDAESNITSGLDYARQETGRTHLQDIALRRCIARLGRRFEGGHLIQIRDRLGEHPLSLALSPGRVPYHRPEHILQPQLEGWWLPGSVESFYQTNRLLQIRAV